MATAAELSVNILANTGQFGPAMEGVRKGLHDTLQSPPGLRSLAEDLHHGQKQLAAFNSLFELGFGFHVSRMFFEKIHEGLMKLGEGFQQGRAYGLSWGEALVAGAGHALGLKTALDDMIESERKAREEAKLHAQAEEDVINAMRRRRDLVVEFHNFLGNNKDQKGLEGFNRERQRLEDAKVDADVKIKSIFAQLSHLHGDDEETKKERDKLETEKDQTLTKRKSLNDALVKLNALRVNAELAQIAHQVDEEQKLKAKKLAEDDKKGMERMERESKAEIERRMKAHEEEEKKTEHDDKQRLEKLKTDLTKAREESKQAMNQKAGALSGRAAERGSAEEAKMLDEARVAMGGNKQVELQEQTNKILNEVKTILAKDKGQAVQDLGGQILAGVASIL